jgi:hypothetical protein
MAIANPGGEKLRPVDIIRAHAVFFSVWNHDEYPQCNLNFYS